MSEMSGHWSVIRLGPQRAAGVLRASAPHNPAPQRTRLHSVPSAFQLVTVAVVPRNILKACLAILSAASLKSAHRAVLLFARNSSISRCPML